jgi:hypothetical protein
MINDHTAFIIPLKKIVFEHFNPDFIARVLFEPKGGKTLLDWSMEFDTAECMISM